MFLFSQIVPTINKRIGELLLIVDRYSEKTEDFDMYE
jgi:hypothetical protein